MQTTVNEQKISTLIRDIKQQAFYPVFQPIVDSDGNSGVEALLRWDNGHHVEESIQTLTSHGHMAWFTGLMCKKVAHEIIKITAKNTFVSINITPSHLVQLTFIRDIYPLWHACNKLGITLWLELTEGEPYPRGIEEKRMLSQIGTCRGMGMKIVLDDYGCGFNVGENILATLRPDVIKLDRTLLKNQCENSMMWARLRFLARKYNMALLAEGIESEDDMKFCDRQGISYYQGYYIGRPLSASELKLYEEISFG